jgi:thiol-disulfide isomerase/thioredoxin
VPRSLRVVLSFMLLLACLPARASRAEMPSDAEMDSLTVMAQDTVRAAQGEAGLRRVMLETPPPLVPLVRHLVTLSLLVQRVDTPTLLACADSALADPALKPGMRPDYSTLIVRELLDRGERLGWADSAAREAMAIARGPDGNPAAVASASVLRARLYLAAEQGDSVVALLKPLDTGESDSREVMWYLARGYDKAGRLDEAIASYVAYHSFAWTDTSISARLRTAYATRHGGFDGLDTLVAGARARARHHETFELARVDGPAPAWTLPTLDGRRRSSREFAGRLTVLEFWGTWCGGCIETMPRFIELMGEARWKGVAFQTVNCESPYESRDPRRFVTAFVRERKWRIPVVQDSAMVTATAYGVNAFPTTVVIDRTGRMRFRNVGMDPRGLAVRDQLSVLLEEERAARTKR